MRGTTLYPLNQLKDIHNDVFEAQAKKYVGREHLLTRRIEWLDCLWNDVLFFTAVEPIEVRRVMERAGVRILGTRKVFKFPLEVFNPKLLWVRVHRTGCEPRYEPFQTERFEVYRIFVEDSIAYYQQALSEGRRPFLFGRVPHILYKGTLDISLASIIET